MKPKERTVTKICHLTAQERLKFEQLANFSVDQKKVFTLLALDTLYSDGIMMALHMSKRRYYQVLGEVLDKFNLLLPQILEKN